MHDQYIRVTAQAEGLHRWPQAPETEDYLCQPHRHLFTAEIRMQVHHGDREIEINDLARWLQHAVLPGLADAHYPAQPLELGTQSCEQLAARIAEAIRERHGTGRWIECEILEDGLLGGGIRWPAA